MLGGYVTRGQTKANLFWFIVVGFILIPLSSCLYIQTHFGDDEDYHDDAIYWPTNQIHRSPASHAPAHR